MDGKELRSTIKQTLKGLGVRNFRNEDEADMVSKEIAMAIERMIGGESKKPKPIKADRGPRLDSVEEDG